jgi:uncharacterized protein GlcG (DUF336 family)
MVHRKIIQVSVSESCDENGWSRTVVAIDDHGDTWALTRTSGNAMWGDVSWEKLPPLPEP